MLSSISSERDDPAHGDVSFWGLAEHRAAELVHFGPSMGVQCAISVAASRRHASRTSAPDAYRIAYLSAWPSTRIGSAAPIAAAICTIWPTCSTDLTRALTGLPP